MQQCASLYDSANARDADCLGEYFWSSFYHANTYGGLGLARCAEEDRVRGSVSDIFLIKIGSHIIVNSIQIHTHPEITSF